MSQGSTNIKNNEATAIEAQYMKEQTQIERIETEKRNKSNRRQQPECNKKDSKV